MKRVSDYFVFFLLIGIISTFYAIFIVGQTDASDMENRELAKLKTFEMKDFIEKTFQNNLEDTISDQIIGAKPIKKKALEVRKDMVGLINSTILTLRNNPIGKYYVAVSDDLYRLNKEEFLIFKEKKNLYNEKAVNYFNTIQGADKYLYFIERDSSETYDKGTDEKSEIYEAITKKLEVTKTSKFSVPNFETYKKYFYKTDHHWNYKGSYQGYKEIAELLGIPQQEQVKITEEKQYDIYFWGSKARNATEYDMKEKFTVYKYNNPKPKNTYIDGKQSTYGKSSKYDKGEYETKFTTNHYGEYYGWDDAEIIFDYDVPQKENLLIISNSYSNAVNEIIASHFNKTYVVDLRRNKEFNANEYIKKNEIDKVLILGDITLFSNLYFLNIDLNNF